MILQKKKKEKKMLNTEGVDLFKTHLFLYVTIFLRRAIKKIYIKNAQMLVRTKDFCVFKNC